MIRVPNLYFPFFLLVVCGLFLAPQSYAQKEEAARGADAQQVAKAWFLSLTQGDTAVTTALSGVPFVFDEQLTVETLKELDELYEKIVEDKGKRALEVAATKVITSTPDKVSVRIHIKGDDDTVLVSVKPGNAFRVIGFRD